jgi:hypothetical protein
METRLRSMQYGMHVVGLSLLVCASKVERLVSAPVPRFRSGYAPLVPLLRSKMAHVVRPWLGLRCNLILYAEGARLLASVLDDRTKDFGKLGNTWSS